MSVISRLKSFQVRPFLTCLCAALVYPLIVLITSEKKLLKFIDALTITGLILLILGVVYSLIRHGDFDIMEYVSKRSFRKSEMKSYEAFKSDKNEERKNSLNYPFLVSILLLLLAGILSAFFY
jgi:hypothetical protein